MRNFLDFLFITNRRPDVGAAGIIRSLSVNGISRLALSFFSHASWLFILSIGILTVTHLRERSLSDIQPILIILLIYGLYSLSLEVTSRKLSRAYERGFFRVFRIFANTAIVAAFVLAGKQQFFWILFALPIFQAILYFRGVVAVSIIVSELTVYLTISLLGREYFESTITPRAIGINTSILVLIGFLFNWLFQAAKTIRRVQQEELEALRRTALEIASELDRKPLLSTIVKRAVELLRARSGGIYLYDKDSSQLTVVADYGPEESLVGRTIKSNEGMAGMVVESGKAMIVDDYARWPGRVGLYDPDLFRAVVEVPLKSAEGMLGVLYVTDDQDERVFNQRDADLLSLLAAHAEIAINNSDVFEKSRKTFRQLQQLYKVNSKLSLSLNVDDILQTTLREALRAVRTDEGSIMILDPKSNELEIRAWMVHGKFVPDKPHRKLRIGEGIAGQVVQSTKAYYCVDTANDEKFVVSFTGRQLGSLLSVPITSHGKVIGVINADHSKSDFFSREDIPLLAALANHVAIALESQKLRDIGILLSTQALDDLYLAIVESACVLTGTEASTILLLTDDVVEHAVRFPHPDPVLEDARDKGGLTQYVLNTGKSVIISDTREDARVRKAVKNRGIRSLMGVPLNVRLEQNNKSVVKAIGALFVDTTQPRTFSNRDEEVLQSLANQAAFAITNARLNKEIERERKHSSELASQLLKLYSYTKEIQSELELPNLLNLIAARAAALLKADAAAIRLRDDHNALILRGAYGLRRDAEAHDQMIDSFMLRSDQSRPSVFVNDLPKSRIRDVAGEIVAFVSTPLLINDETVGRLDVYSNSNPQAFDEADLQMLQLVADQASIAIQRGNSTLRRFNKVTPTAGSVPSLEDASDFSVMLKELLKEEAKRMSEERDDEWRDISFSAAHAIGNPIFAIETILDSLEKRIFEKRVYDAIDLLQSIRRSVDKSKRIINQFKSLSRVQDIKPLPIAIFPLLNDLTNLARSKELHCAIKCDPAVRILGETDRLTQCFDELLTNAIGWVSGPDKKLEIEVIAPCPKPLPSGMNPERHYAVIHFRDNGPGVDDSRKKRIFDLFYSTREDGTGIGLAFISRIIEGHGGFICEVGECGKGADFAIYLPLVASSVAESGIRG